MLINKLTLVTTMFLVALVLAAGGTGLTYRANATEPAKQKEGPEQPEGPSNPAEAVREEIPPPEGQPKTAGAPKEDRPKPTEAPKEDVRRLKDPERVDREEAKSAPLLEENWRSTHQRSLVRGEYTFMALRAGNTALAYNATTREVKAVRLSAKKEPPLWVTPVVMESSNDRIVALGVRGERITRVALFDLKTGKWMPLDLDQPVSGAVWPMSFGPDTVAYEVGEVLYVFNPKTDAWDRLDLRTIADDGKEPSATRGR
jgi:hypothetical protein